LRRNKFTANKKFENPEPGDVMVVGLGGSVSLYVLERDEEVIRRLVGFFQQSDFAGVIFSRIPLEGTFPISTVRIAATNNMGPDVLVSLRWSPEKNQYGTPGTLFSEGGTRNKGSHASLSRFDMRNTLVASGPDFKKGFVNDMPSGNADVVPTILHILGVKPPAPLDGRVLHEAFLDSDVEVPKPETKTIEASN